MHPDTSPHPNARTLLLVGTVGVGKSTVAGAVGDALVARRTPHAVIDLDELRRSWPRPEDDPYDQGLELENLAAVAATYRRRGARHLVLAGVVEHVSDRSAYAEAAGAPLVVVRLHADLGLVRERLAIRHAGREAELAWHLRRVAELDAVLDAARVEDHLVDVTHLDPADTAAAVLRRVGWE